MTGVASYVICCVALLETCILCTEAVIRRDDLRLTNPVSDHISREPIGEVDSRRELIKAILRRWRKPTDPLKSR
ncbi:MAG: hypothetical protein CMJ77_23590 [Planctomycetaceae bacterium]|nr:hypothetical protein [Planctomycetaceae bacterium]